MLNGLDLFSGIGGIATALAPWSAPVAYCENDRYAQSVLLSRMATRDLPAAPIWDDVRSLQASILPPVDIITGGFPCQDISVAGAGAGLEGKRSGLFFEIVRLVGELQPRFVFLENVPAITVRGLDRVLLEFAALGYDARWTIVSAAEVGAPHLRERWFMLAHANGHRPRDGGQWSQEGQAEARDQPGHDGSKEPMAHSGRVGREQGISGQKARGRQPDSESGCGDMANPHGEGCNAARISVTGEAHSRRSLSGPWGSSWWATEPELGRVAHGIPLRVDRLRGLGNAVVPLQARVAFMRLLG